MTRDERIMLRNALLYIADCMIYVNNMEKMPTCNDCIRKNCKYRPEFGDPVRYNCPHHMEGDSE